jgi:hypothetical protein
MANPLFVLAEATTDVGGINPWFVGIGILLLLLALLAVVVVFGGGREHS